MTAFAAVAPLFRYPDETYSRFVDVARTLLSVPELNEFAGEISKLDLSAQQAAYTSTFDLAPSCSPYLGIHLFGEENRDRARLMLGLRSSYTRTGFEADDGELPDHVAEVMAFASEETEDREELLRFVLIPALQKMDALLRDTANPYRHLVSAALHLGGGEL
jgi:nitrate reductase molybdenum cofactor assembly chaperone NarJ/NarW